MQTDLILVLQGCCDKLPQSWWLKTTEIYSVTILKAEAQNQGVGRVGSFWRP